MSEARSLRASGSAPAAPGWMAGLIRDGLLRRLASLRFGRVTVVDGRGSWTVGGGEGDLAPARITVVRPRLYRRLLTGGTLGAAEAWADGDWRCDDLTALLRIFARNISAGDAGRWVTPGSAEALARLVHRRRRNTRRGSRRNIREHYDLGNEFFALFLDATMTYSSGIYLGEDSTLEEASIEKLDRICRKLTIGPGDHVLEIGSGWGSFALQAAGRYGCRVTTTTVSRAQHELASERVREAGLGDRVEVLLEDYRDLRGTYDKLVSIEMVEAVGHENLDGYFAACSRLLSSRGAMLLQGIVMPERDHAAYLRSVDFIQKHIFPGSCLPSTGTLVTAAGRAALRVEHVEDIGIHYARTLADWRKRFRANADRILALGYPERLIRLWEYYFSYCEAGFAERYLGNLQLLLAKPGWRPEGR